MNLDLCEDYFRLTFDHQSQDAVITVVDWWSSKYEMDKRAAVISAKNHKRQRRKRQSVNAKREKSQSPKFLTAILTLPNLT